MKVKLKGRKESAYVMQPGDWLGRDGIVRDAEGRQVSRLGQAIDRERYEALRKVRKVAQPKQKAKTRRAK